MLSRSVASKKNAEKNSDSVKAVYTGPNYEKRQEIEKEAAELFPNDPEKRDEWALAKFGSLIKFVGISPV